MDKKQRTNTGYWLILAFLIIFSYFNFSERYYPLLNSDHAVPVLMTPGFSIPGDLYFWGQSRSGSLVPMLANLLYDVYRFPPIHAVSLVHFIILVLGFLALSTLFKNRFIKILLALIWFFPAWHFLDHVVNVFGLQLSTLACGIWFLNRTEKERKLWKGMIWLALSWFCFLLSVWVSDMSAFSVLILLAMVGWKYWPVISKKNGIRSVLHDRRLLFNTGLTVLYFVIGIGFILYAKRHATRMDLYNQHVFNRPNEIWGSIKMVSISIFEVLTFRSENIVESLWSWLLIGGIPYLLIKSKVRLFSLDFYRKNPWMTFFLLNGIILFGILLLSNWVYANGVGRRYFSIIFVLLWIAVLLFFDRIRSDDKGSIEMSSAKVPRMKWIILAGIIIIGAFSSFIKFYIPKRIPPKIDVLADFGSMGNIGLIGEYWNSYVIAAVDPLHIKATPHDSDMVRNMELAREVFRQPKMYIVKDGWLDNFPDQLFQFHHIILKKGIERRVGDCQICRYEPELLYMPFTWREMKYQGEVVDDSLATGKQAVKIGAGFNRHLHFIYGPYIKLDPGMISVVFRLKASDCLSTDKIAYIDITADNGKKTLASRTIRPADFEQADHYQDFEIQLELGKTYYNLEFRILYLGHSDLWFDKVYVKGRI